MTTRVATVVRLRLPDGREFDIHRSIDAEYAEGHERWWTEGNGDCDCNRSLYLNREYDLQLGVLEDFGEYEMPCGDTITLLSVDVGGERRYGG
jgi:hypothetical protein